MTDRPIVIERGCCADYTCCYAHGRHAESQDAASSSVFDGAYPGVCRGDLLFWNEGAFACSNLRGRPQRQRSIGYRALLRRCLLSVSTSYRAENFWLSARRCPCCIRQRIHARRSLGLDRLRSR